MSRAMRLARAQASGSVTMSGMPSQAKVNWQEVPVGVLINDVADVFG